MSAPAPVEGFDPERTRLEESGTMRSSRSETAIGQLGRGSVLAGKYRLELLLGEGGMGHVWSAYNLELELPVAIKLLRADLKNARLVERLRLEARAAARLVHPSIVRVFDIAVAETGDPFIVMELLSGESLAELLARGRLSGVRAVQLLLPIAEGLALAHAKGIVHRDLKPGNVFLSTNGEQLQPKLLDFGIAKLAQASALASKLTVKGTLLGSPNYMSPEQARGDEVDFRSDIWSFCVVLYKAVMGAAPFCRPDKRAMMDAIASDEPTSITFDANVDRRLAQLIAWGLTKDPRQRPTSIRELGRQLAQWLLSVGVSDDGCGAPLAAKWIAQVAEPSMRRPPPLSASFEPEPSAPIASPASVAQSLREAQTAERNSPSSVERRAPARHGYWALVAVLSMLVAGSSLVWTASTRSSSAPSAMADPIAESGRARPHLPGLPAGEILPTSRPVPPLVSVLPEHQLLDISPNVDAHQRAEPPAASGSSSPSERHAAKPKSSPSASRAGSAPRLPFP